MEVKLGKYMYFRVSMAAMNTKRPKALYPIAISSLFKLANHAMYGSKTWYACVFQCVHDVHEQKIASGTFPFNCFFTSQICRP